MKDLVKFKNEKYVVDCGGSFIGRAVGTYTENGKRMIAVINEGKSDISDSIEEGEDCFRVLTSDDYAVFNTLLKFFGAKAIRRVFFKDMDKDEMKFLDMIDDIAEWKQKQVAVNIDVCDRLDL